MATRDPDLSTLDLDTAIERSVDPGAVRAVLERIADRVAESGAIGSAQRSQIRALDPSTGSDATDRPSLLVQRPRPRPLRDGLIAIAGASRSLATALIADPGLLERDPRRRRRW